LPKNEDGEFELILANRQLLSVFFIIVILLGVFFTMGYIVGRNSAPMIADANSAPKGGNPLEVEAPARPSEPTRAEPTRAEPTRAEPTTAETPAAAAPPSQPPPAGEAVKPPAEPDPAPAPVKSSRPAKASKSEPKGSPAAGQSYLQLAATSQHEADIMVDVLHKKGFKAMTAEIEGRPGTFRVLVGPVADNTANKVRADLQGAGFPGNAAIRRTF
jgi:cell division septation protein DedD